MQIHEPLSSILSSFITKSYPNQQQQQQQQQQSQPSQASITEQNCDDNATNSINRRQELIQKTRSQPHKETSSSHNLPITTITATTTVSSNHPRTNSSPIKEITIGNKRRNSTMSSPSQTLASGAPRRRRNAVATLSSVGPPCRPTTSNSNTNIRSRYLYRLGINSPKVLSKKTAEQPTRTRSGSISKHSPCKLEVLKKDLGQPDRTLTMDSPPLHLGNQVKDTSSSIDTASTASIDSSSDEECAEECASVTSTQSVSFEPCVTVHAIPSRSQYSKRTRQNLWTAHKELSSNARRNLREFAAESYDWRQAAEEEEMIPYGDRLVHPVHMKPSLQQHFLQVLVAQQHS